jgi:DNA-binding MarR family transcriptional regulator
LNQSIIIGASGKELKMRIEAFLKQSPVFQASRIARRMDASLNLLLQEEEVTAFEALILAAIFFEKSGEIKPSALAEAFQTTRGNVSHCISSLEAKGLVKRRIDPEDARAVQLVLRPQGKKRAVRVVGILDRMQRRLEEGIGAGKLEGMLAQMGAVEDICARAVR